MVSIHTIVRVPLDIPDQIVNIKSTNVIRDHVKMVEHVRITTMTTHATVPMDLPEKIVLNM